MVEFEEIYRSYFTDVYCYIRRLSGSAHIADEITSETFLKAMGSIQNFRGACELRVWLCQIAKNLYYSYLASEKRAVRTEETVFPESSGASPEAQCIQKDDLEQIRNVLHHIPEPYKEVFMWRVFAELSFKQIGALFSKSENWACVTYHRARKMIKGRLEDSSYEL